MWNFDLGSQFNVEFLPVYISSTRGITTQEGVKIQQRDQNSTAKEGHNSTKNPLNIDPGSVFNGGVKILSYTGRQVFGCFLRFRYLGKQQPSTFLRAPVLYSQHKRQERLNIEAAD